MSFHPEQYLPHTQHHFNDLRRAVEADKLSRDSRRGRSASRQARWLDRGSRILAACAGWFGGLATELHIRAQARRASQ